MAWDYAELSKAAKDAGGPEKLVETLIEGGKNTGRKEMVPIVGAALGFGALAYAGISKLIQYFKKKKNISPEAVENAKAELIKGIEEYDATHPKEDVKDIPEGGTDNE